MGILDWADNVRRVSTTDAKPPEREIGSAVGDASNTWNAFGGGDTIERVAELQWPLSVVTYASMMNDAQIDSLMSGLTLPIRAFWWYIDPNGAPQSAVDRIADNYNLSTDPVPTDMVQRRRTAKRFSFEKHLEDALRALVYGHMHFEQVGDVDNDAWNLRKLAIRPPRSITEMIVADDGALNSIVQGYRRDGTKIEVPITRLVAYVWDREGANWTGRSMLRSVYRNHIVKDRVLRVGAINIERAGGVPYVQAPEGASGDQIRELDALARRFRVGEGAGAALPHGAQLKFAAATGGDGAVAYIKQQNEEMARKFLQMVSMLGQTNSGSRALGDTFHDILRVAQYTIAKWFADIFNEHVIEDDVEWNEGPDEEYAPQLKFNMGEQDPMMGFREKMEEFDEDPEGEGLQVEDEQVRAMLGRPSRKVSRATAMRRDSARRGSPGHSGRVTAASGEASPIGLPPRPLRRNPYDHEIQAQVDYAVVDSAFDSALTTLAQEIRFARMFQIDELRDAIVAANGNLAALAAITTTVSASDRIRAHLELVAAAAIDAAAAEANRQGEQVPRQPIDDIQESIAARASALDALAREDIVQSARREAIRLTGGGLKPNEVADQTHVFLSALVGAAVTDMVGGAIQASMNEGRRLVFTRDGRDGTLYASELLDTNTCSKCIAVDGTAYQSFADAERDYPTGHYKDCEGRERCRGMVVKVYSKVRDPIEVPA